MRKQYVVFELNKEEYAFPIEDVREVIVREEITGVFHLPDCYAGVISLRGSIIPVMSLKKNFKMEEMLEESRIIVLENGDHPTGVLVDHATQVITLEDEDVQMAPTGFQATSSHCLAGIAHHKDQMILILNAKQLLSIRPAA